MYLNIKRLKLYKIKILTIASLKLTIAIYENNITSQNGFSLFKFTSITGIQKIDHYRPSSSQVLIVT